MKYMDDPERHTNIRYEEELQALRDALLTMGALVERQIAQAVESLVKGNSAQARETIARDVEVNRMDVDIDERCIRLLALYQPAAGDLRLITTGLKITTDLERIGDNAVNICERALELNRHPPLKPYVDIPRMAEIARAMVKDSLEAFTRSDVALAEEVIARDDEVDRLDSQIYHELPGYMAADPKTIPRAAGILFVSKFLERIADHATNIAEMVVFLVKGRTIRHMDLRRRQAELA
jgi:phosphate transport system protein